MVVQQQAVALRRSKLESDVVEVILLQTFQSRKLKVGSRFKANTGTQTQLSLGAGTPGCGPGGDRGHPAKVVSRRAILTQISRLAITLVTPYKILTGSAILAGIRVTLVDIIRTGMTGKTWWTLAWKRGVFVQTRGTVLAWIKVAALFAYCACLAAKTWFANAAKTPFVIHWQKDNRCGLQGSNSAKVVHIACALASILTRTAGGTRSVIHILNTNITISFQISFVVSQRGRQFLSPHIFKRWRFFGRYC